MSDTFAQIGQFLGSNAGNTTLKAATAGGGFLQNWLAQRQANQKQQYVESLLKDPAKFQALVKGAEQPLTQGLQTDIARQTDAYGAERGFGSSPAIMKDVYAQALAPYQQQEQQMAINSVLQRLGVYADQPTMKPVDVSSIFKLLSMRGSPSPDVTSGIDLSKVPDPALTTGDLGLPGPMIDSSPTLPAGGDF